MKFAAGFRSIRHKVMLVVVLSTLSALVVATGAMAYYDLRTYRVQWLNDVATQTELLGGSVAAALTFDDPEAAADSLKTLHFRRRIDAAAVYTARGALFATYTREGETARFPELPGEEGVIEVAGELVSFKRIVENGEILGTAYLRARDDSIDRLRKYAGIFGAVTVGSLLVAVLTSLWLQRVITTPVLAIAEIARQIVTRRQYGLRAAKVSQDEVGNLVDSFNHMLEEIERRTGELEQSNRNLANEIYQRQHAQEELKQLNTELERRVQERTAQLQLANGELESFCYSVSHDLRAPLRAIDGFSQALIEELPQELPGDARRCIDRIRAATLRMGQLIEDLLNLSRVSRGDLQLRSVDISAIAEDVARNLRQQEPGRTVDVSVWEGMQVVGDSRLLRAALENLVGNAWKFTARTVKPRIEIGTMREGPRSVYFVRDNGAGFDMKYSDKLFGAFQRLHGANEYPGTGIGLATVQRIVHRHGGRIWADAAVGKGAVFYFTLSPDGNAASADGGKYA